MEVRSAVVGWSMRKTVVALVAGFLAALCLSLAPAPARAACIFEFTCSGSHSFKLKAGGYLYTQTPTPRAADAEASGKVVKKTGSELGKPARLCVSLIQGTKTYLGNDCGLTGYEATSNSQFLAGVIFLNGVLAGKYEGNYVLVQNTGAREAEVTMSYQDTAEVTAYDAPAYEHGEPEGNIEGCIPGRNCHQ